MNTRSDSWWRQDMSEEDRLAMNAAANKDIHEKLIDVFGSNALYVSDAIKGVMQKHHMDTRDKNLVEAMMEVAIGVKKKW